jgi:hypothetical protein
VLLASAINAVSFGLTVDQAQEARSILQNGGILTLPEYARAHGWDAPVVLSSWAVARLPNGTSKENATASLKLGQEIAAQLDSVAVMSRTSNSRATEHALIKGLWDFADWIGGGRGSGNAMLARRSFDLGTLPLGRILASNELDMNEVADYESRLVPQWDSTRHRAEVLNSEIGKPVFDLNAADLELRDTWMAAVKVLAVKTLVSNGFKADEPLPSDQSKALDLSGDYFELRKPANAPTTSDVIGLKNTEFIVNGLVTRNALDLRALMAFRRLVNQLPDKADPTAMYPGLKGAFDEAWRKAMGTRLNDDNATIGLTSWLVYDSIVRAQMLDQDGQLVRNTGVNLTRLPMPKLNLPKSSPRNVKSAIVNPPTSTPKAPSAEPPNSTPWDIVALIIAAATGLLWLLLKRRTK